ncbi:response regulator [Thalassotalea sp. PLHSN55]|uniref:response regulator n=1 Tax=Thalassotalea sp. PLHSN55 TaxID=3435888 RepID=UPI003F87314A
MKAKPNIMASRHPQVVMVFDHEEDVHGAVEILNSHFEHYRTIAMNKETTRFLTTTRPAVILFALKSVASGIEYYSDLVESAKLSHPHFSVLLCSNKESALAFRCCVKGLFDNYFVYQPLYEKYRLVMIVHNGLAKAASDTKFMEFNEENFEEIDEQLAQLIDDSSEVKKALLGKVEKSREDILKATESYQQQPEIQQLSTEQIMDQVTENHVKPLLSLLENDIKSGLDSMISQLLAAQTCNKEKEIKSKGLISHQPSIKKRKKPEAETESAIEESSPHKTAQPTPASTLVDDELVNDLSDELPEIADPALIIKNKILVVEDNALYRDMLVNVLSKENFEIDEAEDGLCALKKIKQHEYDLIIMDLFMPKLDGLNVTKKIRQVSGGKDIPVIALTGNKNKELIRKWAAYGLKGYIIKPSSKEEILSSVSRVFKTAATQ